VLVLIAACAPGQGTGAGDGPASGQRVRVVATTTFVADLARRIGDPHIEVVGLMGPGVDPHLFKASAGDVRRMGSGKAVLSNGLHLEGKIGDVLAQMGTLGVESVAVGECVDPQRLITAEGFSGVHDPHIWFDVGLWAQTIDCVRDTFERLDPAHRETFEANARAYRARLEQLDAWVRSEIAGLPEERRVLVTAHDAFGYLGRAYGLEVHGLLGVSTASEAGTGDVESLARLIVERRVPAIFVETSVPPRYIEALREAVRAKGHEVRLGGSLYSDALGSPGSDAETYVGTVRHNVTTIVIALGGDEDPGPEPEVTP
jgi:manganese/zinc/iron transport system substrate-binding protein